MIKNKLNGKRYIGITRWSIEKRRTHHLWKASTGGTGALSRAIRKYGSDAFSFSALDIADSWPALQFKERIWIKFFGSKAPGGYNLTDGGEGTLGFPSPMKGRTHTAEVRARLALLHLGKKASPEARLKMSIARMGNKYSVGVNPSQETRRKISAAGMGRICPWRGQNLPLEWRENMKKAIERRRQLGLPVGAQIWAGKRKN